MKFTYQRQLKSHPLLSVFNNMLVDYPTALNLSFLWNFGSLAGFCLILQLLTGITLAMHYTGQVDFAFNSVEHIMRDVNSGWILRYSHANGASMFFIVVYIHIFRGIYYGSYMLDRKLVWEIGVIIFFLMIMTAFIGYVLPWGQMSFWAATVITNLCSAIPTIGNNIVLWLWGGFSVGNATLNRFFSLHYLLPFVISALAFCHLIVLHQDGSNNPLGITARNDVVPFHPYFSVKDYYGVALFMVFFSYFIFGYPNLLGHSDNYIPANSLVTPAHIVPEWYFLPFYAVLRSIPDKLFGVVAMASAIFILLLLPYLNFSSIRSTAFKPVSKFFFWYLMAIWGILGFLGGQAVEEPFYLLGQISTLAYFCYFLVLVPGLALIEGQLSNSNLSEEEELRIMREELIRFIKQRQKKQAFFEKIAVLCGLPPKTER